MPGWKHRDAGSTATQAQAGVAMLPAGTDGDPLRTSGCAPPSQGEPHPRARNPYKIRRFFDRGDLRNPGSSIFCIGWNSDIGSGRLRIGSSIMSLLVALVHCLGQNASFFGHHAHLQADWRKESAPRVEFLKRFKPLGPRAPPQNLFEEKVRAPLGAIDFSENKLRRARPFRRGPRISGFCKIEAETLSFILGPVSSVHSSSLLSYVQF